MMLTQCEFDVIMTRRHVPAGLDGVGVNLVELSGGALSYIKHADKRDRACASVYIVICII